MEILIVVAIYTVTAYVAMKYIWSPKVKQLNSGRAKLGKSLLLAALFGPSAFISVHAIIPLPALLGLIAGISYESVRVSSFEAFLIFICSVAVSSAVLYWYFTVTKKIRLSQCLNLDSVEKPTSQIK